DPVPAMRPAPSNPAPAMRRAPSDPVPAMQGAPTVMQVATVPEIVTAPAEEPVEEIAVPRSLFRSVISKLLFFFIFPRILPLLAYELSVVFHIPWLAVRRLLAKLH